MHRSEGRLAAAESAYRQAVAARPGHVNALFNLGLMLKDAGNFTEARVQLERAVLLRNGWAPAHAALGALALDQREFAASVRHLAASIAADPRQPDVWYWLGNAHMGAGDAAAAVAAYRAAIRLDANHVKARWGVVMSQVPPVLALDEPAEKGVRAFGRELAALKGWLRVKQPSEAYQAVGAQQPYYLAYTEGNHRDSMREYGMLCTNLMAQWSRRSGLPKPTSSTGGRCRLGIVSSHLYDHSVWNAVVRGWVEHLDASKFEVHLFHTGHIRDSQTQWAITRVGRLHTISGNWQNSARAISDARMDVLLYPEIGMEATTTRLASLRLARLQMASWGHPLTTGLPTIDGYLSAEAFEPDQAQEHYSEKLHALPGLGCCYRPFGTRASPVDWSAVGLKSGQPFFLCAGTSFKYSPAHDALWVEVARRCRDTRLIFFRGQVGALSAQLELRLAQVFAQSGVDYARSVSFIEWQSQPAFFGLLEKCTAMLDSPGFSGFNTVMQAMECGTPVVAWEGAAMRSRFASGILRQIGLEGWVASDVESFASVAEGALSNQARHATRLQIGRQRQTLFNNKQPVDALGQLLLASSA